MFVLSAGVKGSRFKELGVSGSPYAQASQLYGVPAGGVVVSFDRSKERTRCVFAWAMHLQKGFCGDSIRVLSGFFMGFIGFDNGVRGLL